jgi:signal transduction histidine kinase
VHADRDDEFGRLADVFNRAAERVRESQLLLEEKVAARTRALERAQDELVRREKLAILGLLASGLSHELRNPLGVMTNAVYYLDGVLVDPPGQVKRYLRILREQIARAEKIVGDLVDFVGVEPPQRQPVAIHALVEGPLARVTVPAHVRVERDIPAQVPPAYVDPSQMGQVMENLLINAVQAIGDEPGVVSVRVAVHDRSHLRVEIGDTGPGIPPDRLDRIFDPLFTTKATGIGLGLPISRTLAAANHATISVTSEEGRGSTFTVVVPTHQEAVAA